MNFLKNITKHQIFEKVAEIANVQIKEKIKSKLQSTKQTKNLSQNNSQLPSTTQNLTHEQPYTQPTYQQAEQFIINLSHKSRQIFIKQMQKKTKKKIFQQLQIDPIYLQQCSIQQLFRMEIEFGNRYERTEVLHDYLNQVNQTIKAILFSNENYGNRIFEESFDLIQRKLNKLHQILVRIKFIRQSISKIQIQKAIQIKNIMQKKLVIKQKLSLLQSMKQKQDISLIKPQNLQQIYYSERNRHKLYTKIKAIKITNSYFNMLKNQIILISQNNSKIIAKQLDNWVNKNEQMRDKNIEKLFICLYFIKTQPIYKDNHIDMSFRGLNRQKFVEKIQSVKQWKNYQYIRDPAMKSKINQFLNLLIEEINITQ